METKRYTHHSLFFRQLLFISFYLFASSFCFAQKPTKIELVAADVLTYNEQSSKVRKLIGNVAFKHENTFLYCDSAYLYTDVNRLEAYGHVYIKNGDSLRIRGDRLLYNGNTRKAELFENIHLTDTKMKLTTNRLNYDLEANMADYNNWGKVIDKENTLTSMIGNYFALSKKFLFKGNVKLVNPHYTIQSDTLQYDTQTKAASFFGATTITNKGNQIYCENGWYDTDRDVSSFSKKVMIITGKQTLKADSIYYNRKQRIGKAYSNVEIRDTSENIIIYGNRADYDESSETSVITDKALLIQVFDEDTLFLHADTLKVLYDSIPYTEERTAGEEHFRKYKILLAYRHVKIYKPDLQGSCDSLVYSDRDSTLRFYKKPVLWSAENQITADFISLQQNNNKFERMDLYNAAFIISREDSIRYNQIKGKNMTGYFKDNALYKIKVEGNGQTIYYGRSDKGELVGVNKAECSNIWIYINKNKIEKVTLLNTPDAIFYPIGEMNPEDLLLKGFNWQGELQPKSSADIF